MRRRQACDTKSNIFNPTPKKDRHCCLKRKLTTSSKKTNKQLTPDIQKISDPKTSKQTRWNSRNQWKVEKGRKIKLHQNYDNIYKKQHATITENKVDVKTTFYPTYGGKKNKPKKPAT